VGADPGAEGAVGQHQIQLLARELAEEVLDRPILSANEVDRLGELERRLKQLLHQNLGQRVRDADGEPQRSGRRSPLQHAHQVLSERKDLVRVSEDAAPDVRQHEIPPRAIEQLVAEHVLEPLHLTADRRL